MVDLYAGRIALFLDVANTGIGVHQRGEARALAVSSSQRMTQAPDIPTFAEGGVAGADSYTWHMILAPGGTPAPVVQAINAAFNRVLALPHVGPKLSEMAIQLRPGSTPETTAQWLREEVAKWGTVFRDAGIRVE
jgi:tripartite-type tricarboxylate transporter receptor subunit TctC